ncbi:periphilin-1 isoform X2 [Stigmatopora argus]
MEIPLEDVPSPEAVRRAPESEMTYRRERSARDGYEDRFMPDRAGRGQYSRGGERRGHFGRPDSYEYEGGPRFFPNGGPRNYHGEDQRGYHGDGGHFPSERRGGPPPRREDYSYRGPREEQHAGRPMEYNNRAPPPPPPPPPPRNQGLYPAARSIPESGSDTLMQAILNMDRGDERPEYRRKAPPFPTARDRSPHSRSGSSVSSRGYSPDRSKSLPFSSQQGKKKIPGLSREGSPSSATSNKEETNTADVEKEEPSTNVIEEAPKTTPDCAKEPRTQAIAAKAQEIEKMYRQDCETFGMVVKMLVAKDPNLEKQLQVPLKENLGELRERCLEDFKHFISELNEPTQQTEPNATNGTPRE